MKRVVPLFGALLAVPLPAERYAARSVSPQQAATDPGCAGGLVVGGSHPAAGAGRVGRPALGRSHNIELLGLLVEQTPTAAMLHVLTFRPEFSPPWPTRSHLRSRSTAWNARRWRR